MPFHSFDIVDAFELDGNIANFVYYCKARMTVSSLVCGKKQVLQDPGYVGGVKGPCYMLYCKVV